MPFAQGAILETRDRIPRRAPGAWSLLLPLPVSASLSLSLSVTIINKFKKKKILQNCPGFCSLLPTLFGPPHFHYFSTLLSLTPHTSSLPSLLTFPVLCLCFPQIYLPCKNPTQFIFFLRFYLFIHETHREIEAETQAEGEAGSMQGA